MIERLQPSDNIEILEKGDSVLVYHRLFGNPLIFPREILTLFDFLTRGKHNEIEVDEETIIELKNCGFLVKEQGDDIALYNKLVKQNIDRVLNGENIEVLDLSVSEQCNFGCKHCILSGNKDCEKDLMSFEEAKQIVDEYVKIIEKNGGDTLNIHFGSGEPFLNWNVVEKVVEYVKRQYSGYKFKFSINTNLSLLTKKRAFFLRDNQVDINSSIDGDKEGHDTIRTFKNGKGTYDLIIKKIELLKNIGYPLNGINLTLTNGNYKLIDNSFIDWCKKMGFSALGYDVDLLDAISIEGETVESISEKLIGLYKHAEDNGIEVFGTWTLPFVHMMEQSINKGVIPFFCSAVAGKNLAVGKKGITNLCSYTEVSVGNILGISFGESSEFGEIVKSHIPGSIEKCKGCSIEGFCSGQCHATKESAINSKNLDIFNTMCSFYKLATKKLLENELEKNLQNK